jgi:mono/diheme cytochrome c family protein
VILVVSPLANGTDEGEAEKGVAGTAETGGTVTGNTETGKEETGTVATPAGQKVFTDAQCQLCHTVYSSGIGQPPTEDTDADTEAEDGEGRPDLSAVGVGRTAEWMSLYMKKRETIEDRKHMLSFSGSDEDLATLVDWLLTLKPAEVAAPEAAKAEAAEAEKGE